MDIPHEMRAVTWLPDGEVRIGIRPVPAPGRGQLLVRVRAAGINNADLLQARGYYPAPSGWPNDILGLELAGRVVGVGEGCNTSMIGKHVCAVVGGGAQAEYALVYESSAMEIPRELAWVFAGAFPEAAATAWDALVRQASLGIVERVLVTGAAGGVGVLAIQIAASRGAEVVASARSDSYDENLLQLGASIVARPDKAHEHGPFDVVLELVGAQQMNQHLKALSSGGRIIVIGVGSGYHAEVDLLELMQKRALVRGSTLRTRKLDEHAVIARELQAEVIPMLSDASLQVPIEQRFTIDQINDAHAAFKRGNKFGKFVLTF